MRSPFPIIVSLLVAVTVIACEDPSSSPGIGVIRVSVSTTGGDPDSLYYVAAVGLVRQMTGNSFTELNAPRGMQTVELSGVDANCILDGSAIRSVEVGGGDTARVSFRIDCAETGIRIEARATGSEIPESLGLTVSGAASAKVMINSFIKLTRLAPGRHDVTIQDGNCSTLNGSTRSVEVVNRQVTLVVFELHCEAFSLSGDVAFVSSGMITLMRADGTNHVPLAHGLMPAWSRDNKKIVYSTTGCDYYTYLCSGSLHTLDLENREIARLANTQLAWFPSWSPVDDVIVYTDAVTSTLQLYDVAKNTVTQVGETGITALYPSWSPDGTKIVAMCTGGTGRLCILNRDGTNLHRVTASIGSYETQPSWSPDGSSIVFVTHDWLSAINVVRPDGSGQRVVAYGESPAWSPDSKKIIFTDGTGLFVVKLDGSNLRRLTSGPAYSPAWRP